MYPLVFGCFYLLSLIPWRIMYIFSDISYLLIYHVIKYRRDVVMQNLTLAFPHKTQAEKQAIAKAFYKNFTDTFVETIKLISISDKEFDKRCKVNIDVVNNLLSGGQSVQLHTGHFFNWEFANLGIAKHIHFPWIGVYMPIKNKNFDKLMLKMRSKYNTILLPATSFKSSFHQYSKNIYALGLAADQNPGNPHNAFWTPFFGKMTPFVTGPERGAVSMNTAVVMINFYKIKRGHYQIDAELLTTTPQSLPKGTITKSLVRFIENAIQERPANYLWSHRRWKWEYNEEQFAKYKL